MKEVKTSNEYRILDNFRFGLAELVEAMKLRKYRDDTNKPHGALKKRD